MLLIPPVVLKLGSTGYRFARYYTGNPPYLSKGPPPAGLRLLAPGVVLTTLALFGTGVALLFAGPPSHTLIFAHKLSFIAWVALMAIHVLGHLLELPRLALSDWRRERAARGAAAPARATPRRCADSSASVLLGRILGPGTFSASGPGDRRRSEPWTRSDDSRTETARGGSGASGPAPPRRAAARPRRRHFADLLRPALGSRLRADGDRQRSGAQRGRRPRRRRGDARRETKADPRKPTRAAPTEASAHRDRSRSRTRSANQNPKKSHPKREPEYRRSPDPKKPNRNPSNPNRSGDHEPIMSREAHAMLRLLWRNRRASTCGQRETARASRGVRR